ncbi:helicase-related protein [Cohnella hashimotonis]|uniref:Helicase-related protein n=1 Tax=Cohnella hashimotonis TaxID=2826895 RepID=A0ABT6TU20_9BACL|nr:helicase-related protein [Cohnella hashimotonis]MDI4650343.1 helicase-related protein [Cohnella hashimotonis]
MRAIVYAVRMTTGWQARYTVDWETDMAYWLDAKYRECLVKAWGQEVGGGFAVGRETASMIVKMKRSLPLGDAEVGCSKIQAKLGGKGETLDAGAVERILLRVFGGAEAARTIYSSHVGVPLPPGIGSGCELLLPVPAGELGRGAEARLQALRLRVIAPLFQGRSLLQAEAVALLAEHAPGVTLGAGLAALAQLGALIGALRLGAAVADGAPRGAARQSGRLRCRRCGSGEAAMRRSACAACGSGACAVCEACLALGRSRACGLLVRGPAPAASPLGLGLAGAAGPAAADICARWGLSPAQRVASEQAVRFLLGGREPGAEAEPGQSTFGPTAPRAGRSIFRFRRRSAALSGSEQTPPPEDPMAIQPRSFLLWAVTGAGKTEMIFPLLDAVLSAGGRALLATPRRDVVLELAPRLAKAFPARSIAVLYGGSGERWQQAELTLATTHQLMRFGQAFDLVLIDELDAFPYHGDPMLHHAAAAARKPDGSTVLLSATPPPALRRAVRFGRLPCARVPVRYHRHPLPMPRIMCMPPLHRWSVEAAAASSEKRPDLRQRLAGRQAAALFACIASSLARGAQVFVFVPYIKQIDSLVALFRRQAPVWGISPAFIDGTSSQDDGRRDKVVAFRERELRLLVTTTILERGVTVPRSDVFILDAHAKLFDEAALVQMAGRAGRSADDPAGRVFFYAAHRTQALTGAIRQVAAMNRLALRGGYLLEQGSNR